MAAGHQKLKRFADYADGSLLELETQLTLAKRLNFLHVEEAVRLFRMTRETGQLLKRSPPLSNRREQRKAKPFG